MFVSGDLSISEQDSITCQDLERKQRNNDLELLRIELESKKLQIEALKHEFQSKYDELEERAQQAERSSRLYQTKLSHVSGWEYI